MKGQKTDVHLIWLHWEKEPTEGSSDFYSIFRILTWILGYYREQEVDVTKKSWSRCGCIHQWPIILSALVSPARLSDKSELCLRRDIPSGWYRLQFFPSLSMSLLRKFYCPEDHHLHSLIVCGRVGKGHKSVSLEYLPLCQYGYRWLFGRKETVPSCSIVPYNSAWHALRKRLENSGLGCLRRDKTNMGAHLRAPSSEKEMTVSSKKTGPPSFFWSRIPFITQPLV